MRTITLVSLMKVQRTGFNRLVRQNPDCEPLVEEADTSGCGERSYSSRLQLNLGNKFNPFFEGDDLLDLHVEARQEARLTG